MSPLSRRLPIQEVPRWVRRGRAHCKSARYRPPRNFRPHQEALPPRSDALPARGPHTSRVFYPAAPARPPTAKPSCLATALGRSHSSTEESTQQDHCAPVLVREVTRYRRVDAQQPQALVPRHHANRQEAAVADLIGIPETVGPPLAHVWVVEALASRAVKKVQHGPPQIRRRGPMPAVPPWPLPPRPSGVQDEGVTVPALIKDSPVLGGFSTDTYARHVQDLGDHRGERAIPLIRTGSADAP